MQPRSAARAGRQSRWRAVDRRKQRIVLPEIVVTAGDGGDGIGDGTDGTEGGNLVQLAGDIPTGDSPEIPEERPPTSEERTSIQKTVANLLPLIPCSALSARIVAEVLLAQVHSFKLGSSQERPRRKRA